MPTRLRKQQIPWLMAGARAALGPIMIAGAVCRWNGIALAAMIVAALLSDIFDGILARRWQCDTAAVRLFDSMADTVFYLGVAVALWIANPQLLHTHAALLAALLSLEAARFVFDFAKFGKPASYHSYLAKTWGLLLAIAVVTAFANGPAGTLFSAALILGIVCNLEGFAMSLVLPVWRRDIKTLRTAWRLRSDIGAIGTCRPKNLTALLSVGVVLIALGCTQELYALEPGHAIFAGGTTHQVKVGDEGELDTASPTTLRFHISGLSQKEIYIPYANISSFTYRTEVAHHLGVLPLIAVGLFLKRERVRYISIVYTTSPDEIQTVVFEIPASDPRVLLPMLKARVPICQTKASPCPTYTPE